MSKETAKEYLERVRQYPHNKLACDGQGVCLVCATEYGNLREEEGKEKGVAELRSKKAEGWLERRRHFGWVPLEHAREALAIAKQDGKDEAKAEGATNGIDASAVIEMIGAYKSQFEMASDDRVWMTYVIRSLAELQEWAQEEAAKAARKIGWDCFDTRHQQCTLESCSCRCHQARAAEANAEPFANRDDDWWRNWGADPHAFHSECGRRWREHRYTGKGGEMCPPGPEGDYTQARGILPWKPGDEMPENKIRRSREQGAANGHTANCGVNQSRACDCGRS